MSGIWDMRRKNAGILEQNVNNLFQNEKKEKNVKKTKETKTKVCYPYHGRKLKGTHTENAGR